MVFIEVNFITEVEAFSLGCAETTFGVEYIIHEINNHSKPHSSSISLKRGQRF
jgi:hypothetical protein